MAEPDMRVEPVLRLGISACLLGDEVRWNGGHKRSAEAVEGLGPLVEWVPTCPEVEIGLGVPRPPIHLENRGGDARLVTEDGTDLSPQMDAFAESWLDASGLHGFVLKRGSPSCGPANVSVVHGPDDVRPIAMGRFAAHVQKSGAIPVIDEGRLRHPGLRESFLNQCLARRRWLEHLASGEPLSAFHAREKYMIMAHHPASAKQLGQVAASDRGSDAVRSEYAAVFRDAMQKTPSRGLHVNALEHMAGFIKEKLDRSEKTALQDQLEAYRAGHVPLVVPLALLRFLLETRDAPAWVLSQSYLDPYPAEWRLRQDA